jgi:hypothetical protein
MILAMITVYQCEDCPQVMICRHDIDYEIYEATWFDGLKFQFCPICRFKPQAEDRIEEDRQRVRSIRDIGQTSFPTKIEYAN